MKVLVTGCAGFIGSHLLSACIEAGHEVVGLDNFSAGTHNKTFLNTLSGQFEFINADIRDLSSCVDACQDVDVVLHQAAIGSVPRSLKHPDLTFQNNVLGFHNMLYAAKCAGVHKFIYASSSSVHGDDGILKSPYALSKFSNDLYAGHFAGYYGIQTVGLRYFNVFGPRQNPDGSYAAVIPKWAKLIAQRSPITIYGDGQQSRDFTYVKNVVMANMRAMHESFQKSGVYDIGCGDTYTLNQLFHFMVNHMGVESPPLIVYTEARTGDVRYSKADITKAKADFGYNPTWNLPMGLEDYLV